MQYKKSSYFQIKVQDKNKTLLKNIKLKVTVKSGKNIKVFNIKTNSKGIAKFNTKGLKVGKYSVNITSTDENYTVSKTSKIFVGKQYSTMLRFSRVKVLKNKDTIRFKVVYDKDKGKEVTVVFKNKAKYTKIQKQNSFSTIRKQRKQFQEWNTVNLKMASGNCPTGIIHSDI